MEIVETSDYPCYYVAENGNVFSTKRGGMVKLKLKLGKAGYYEFTPYVDGTKKTVLVHRLVAKAFLSNPDNKAEVNHKNGIKTDNRVENLEWVTKDENAKHASDMGLYKTQSDHGGSPYTEQQIRKACALLENKDLSYVDISKVSGVSEQTLNRICYGMAWQSVAEEYDLPRKNRQWLSEEEVKSICDLLSCGYKVREVSEKLNYSFYTVRSIRYGYSYKKFSKKYLHISPTTIESTSEDGSE